MCSNHRTGKWCTIPLPLVPFASTLERMSKSTSIVHRRTPNGIGKSTQERFSTPNPFTHTPDKLRSLHLEPIDHTNLKVPLGAQLLILPAEHVDFSTHILVLGHWDVEIFSLAFI
jgi:hypothetical protein